VQSRAPVANEAVEILKARREETISELVSSLIEVVPQYAQTDARELRGNVEALFNLFLDVVQTKDTATITGTLDLIARRRIEQGFATADFTRALLMVYPVARRQVRAAGPRNDASMGHAFQEIEEAVFRIVAVASNLFSANVKRNVEKKLSDAEKSGERLKEKSRVLEAAVARTQRELLEVQELNERVIASLNSGVIVVTHPDARVILWSHRAAEISGIKSEEAVGRTALELAPRLKGAPIAELVATVRAMDRLPLTKVVLETPTGKRHLYLRAERLHGGETSEVRGTVVLLDDITERELLIDSFSRYVSRDVVQRLLSRSGKSNKLEGERRNCSVLFADIRGFTGISERLGLEALHLLINQYFRVMIDLVAAHDGNIDKFIGDKIMAVFTSRDGDGAVGAARAALAIIREIDGLNAARKAQGEEAIGVGIGINTGEVVMGTVGSEERMSFTVIGDAVNVADRLQSLAGPGEIYIGSRTCEALGPGFKSEDLGERSLKGRTSTEHIFKLLKEGA
jgi:PAS domain S-box-containing protein